MAPIAVEMHLTYRDPRIQMLSFVSSQPIRAQSHANAVIFLESLRSEISPSVQETTQGIDSPCIEVFKRSDQLYLNGVQKVYRPCPRRSAHLRTSSCLAGRPLGGSNTNRPVQTALAIAFVDNIQSSPWPCLYFKSLICRQAFPTDCYKQSAHTQTSAGRLFTHWWVHFRRSEQQP